MNTHETAAQIEARFWKKVRKSDGCWLWTGKCHVTGYGQFRYKRNKNGAHRYSWELANKQEIPKGKLVCHTCDTRSCVRPDHLYVGTHADNARDMFARGRGWLQNHPECILRGDDHPNRKDPNRVRGDNSPRSKLNSQQVLEIRNTYTPGQSDALAAKYGVSASSIRHIVSRSTWRHL